jgi:hypothetical protein
MIENPKTADELSDSSEDTDHEQMGDVASNQPSTDHLGFLFQHMDRVLDCLFDLSIAIRNPATRTLRTSKYTTIDISPYRQHDIDHVRNKLLPISEAQTPETRCRAPGFLVERLAFANLERRQFFIYQQRHHEKLQQEQEKDFPESHSQTTATKYNRKDVRENDDIGSLYAASDASCVTTGDGQPSLSFPPLPIDASDSKYFECPYCYEMLAVSNTREWRYGTIKHRETEKVNSIRKHILLDLRPYICVFEKCPNRQTLFSTRKEWSNHEIHYHWNYWRCNKCQQKFPGVIDFEVHMRRDYKLLAADYRSSGLAKTCRISRDKNSPILCELCGIQTTLKDRFRHLGRHMEDIALFALGTWEGDGEDEVTDDIEEGSEQEEEEVAERSAESTPGIPKTEDMSVSKNQESGDGQQDHSRQNEYFVPGDDILSEVIHADICRYLGNDAMVRPGTYLVCIDNI